MRKPSIPVRPTARTPCADESRHELMVYGAGENFEHRIQDLLRGHAQAVDKSALNPTLGEEAGHLFAAAMHDDRLPIGGN